MEADKVLSRDEFQASGLAQFVPGMALSTWQEWDRDGNGSISREDCRGLLDIAFGVRRLTGEPLRFDSGIIVNAMLFGQIDANNDDRLSFEEFVQTGFEGNDAKPRFREADVDGDAMLSFAEFATMQYRWIDPVADFMRIDTDLDGRIDRAELLQASPEWQQPIARHLFPGFDLDRDGFLSLDEYRRLPFVNLLARWFEPRRDSDNDGLLSRGDFRWSKSPALASLEAEFFRCFDLNQDDVLDLTEFDFQTGVAKAP